MTTLTHRSHPVLTAAHSIVRQPAIVLVDPVLSGKPFKNVCARAGYAVASVYTLPSAVLEAMDRDHRAGDAISVYSSDVTVLESLLASAVPDVRAIIPTAEPATQVASVLAELRGVPGNSARTGLARRDKIAMRELAVRRGLRVPRFEVTERDGIPAAARRIGFPVIIKPPAGAAAHGVRLISSQAELDQADAGPDADLFGNPITQWLVEEYIRGPEYAVNTFSHGGEDTVIDIWEYRQLDDRDYDYPYRDFLQTEPDPQVSGFALDVLRAFEISVGPAHIEIKMGPQGPVLIELGARLPGADIPLLWQRHSSFRPYHDTVAAHLGGKPRVLRGQAGFRASVGMTFIRNDGPPGVLRSLNGVGAASRLPGVDAVYTRAKVGDLVPTSDHLGAELVKAEFSAPSHRELRELADKVRKLITAWVEPVPDAAAQPAA